MLAATYLHQAGTYLDAQFNFMRIASDLSDTTGASLVSGVISTAPVGSIKLGHTFDLGDGAGLTPHLKLARGQVRTKAHVDAEGRDVAASRKQIRELTAGAEYATMLAEGAKFSLFGDYTRDLAPDSHVSVNGFDLASSGPRDWAKIGMRLETPVGKRSGLSGEVFYKTAFGDGSGGNRDLSGRVAVDIRW
jgi:outer membrane autotransporter protein